MLAEVVYELVCLFVCLFICLLLVRYYKQTKQSQIRSEEQCDHRLLYLFDIANKMFSPYLGWNSPDHQLEDSILATLALEESRIWS